MKLLYSKIGGVTVLAGKRLIIVALTLFTAKSSRKFVFINNIPYHKISHPQAFWAAIFLRCPPSDIFFLMDYSKKLIRSSEIYEEPPQ